MELAANGGGMLFGARCDRALEWPESACYGLLGRGSVGMFKRKHGTAE